MTYNSLRILVRCTRLISIIYRVCSYKESLEISFYKRFSACGGRNNLSRWNSFPWIRFIGSGERNNVIGWLIYHYHTHYVLIQSETSFIKVSVVTSLFLSFQVKEGMFDKEKFDDLCWMMTRKKNFKGLPQGALLSENDCFKLFCLFNLLSEDRYPLVMIPEEVKDANEGGEFNVWNRKQRMGAAWF